MFKHLNVFFTPSHFGSIFFLSCACSAGLCEVRDALWGLGGTVSLECAVWPLLILERQQGAFGPFNGGVQGVFSPGSVISALGFDQQCLPCPLLHHCAITPWSCPGLLEPSFPKSEGIHNQTLLFPSTDKSL